MAERHPRIYGGGERMAIGGASRRISPANRSMPDLRVNPADEFKLISAVTAYNPPHDLSALADHRTPDREQYNAISHRSAR